MLLTEAQIMEVFQCTIPPLNLEQEEVSLSVATPWYLSR